MPKKAKKMHKGLPVKGYADQPAENVYHVNKNKDLEELVLRRIENVQDLVACDGRWLAIARTHIEQGFGALNRAIMQPKRISGELSYGPIETGGAQEPPTAAD